MEGDTNQTAFDVNVYFVVPSQYESEKECNEDMWDAYNKCPDWDISPEWISEKRCLKMKPEKKDVFVMETFSGETFEKLQEFKCTIIGPRCLLSCFLTGEPIPEGLTPIFNTAMRGIVVSPSGFNAAIKSKIQKRVEYMGGIFTRQLRGSVTHLVTDTVISAKYERAVEIGIKIVTIDWVESVWITNLKDNIPASDKVYDKYKCPVFLNLIVTSTNLPKHKKEEVKRLVNSHGGEFMGVLDGSKIKIVITLETSKLSDKLKYAMQNNIPCLKVEWIYESIEAGYSLPITNYQIKSTQACSTPEKSTVNEPLNFSTISLIPGDNPNFVDETLASATTMSSTIMSSTLSRESVQTAVPKTTYITVLDRLDIAEAKKAGPFLDGCNIYLTGFSSNYRDKLNRILNVGSATRLDEISDALTHVIVGDAMKATQDLRVIKSKGLYPYILKVEWLEECMKIQAPAPEENFLFNSKDTTQQAATEPPSPLSKKNLQLLQRPKIPAAPLFDDSKFTRKPENDEASEIVQQYLQNSKSEPDNSLREILKLPSTENFDNDYNATKNQSISERWNDTTKKDIRMTMNAESRDDSAIPISQESIISQKLFRGLVFIITGFDDEELIQIVGQIQELGGRIVDRKYSGIPDYGIVPILGAELKHTVGEIVTNLFIEDCIDNEKLVNIEYYHTPITIAQNVKPLANCVIGMSTYAGVERRYLSELSEALGARYQDTFARKTNLVKDTYSSTHLICPMPQGEKYNAAVKWKLPAVTAEWLLQCAAKMKLVNESEYLVGETMAPERPDVTITNDNATKLMGPPNGPTPKRHTLSKSDTGEDGMKTPVINKRLNNLISDKTPQSPFHISTPETPYGQLFKENPSPRTRKGWVKWIDHFPDIPIEEPPPKRKRSTPMSEVFREAWDYVAGRFDSEEGNEVKSASENENNAVQKANGADDPQSSHMVTNRKLSFSDENSPNKTPNNQAVKLQLEQLDNLLKEASNTPETRQSLSSERAKPYQLESNHQAVRCLAKESQPDSVGWEDPVKRVPPQRRSTLNEESIDLENEDDLEDVPLASKQESSKPKFMFSGIKEKAIAEKLIKELGGEVSTESSFDITATHLLCLKPARNEKVLGSIASGKWVLHYLYIEACRDEKKFVDEEEFELGNPKSVGKIPDPSSENEKMIMSAAHRWRMRLLKNPGGAFRGMVALLIVQQEKREQFERLIHAGGGIVVEAKPPYDNSPKSKKITHCFVQLKQVDQKLEWATMANKGIMCFPPQYLNDALMSEKPLNPRECVLPDFQKYLALLPK
ncbi:DNA topoisomerase 2-binding protein 1-A [Nasonia vitripennis]|uniref:BRCT domain-containing protein n=1 Tax=Nasonia vitripennis TaxID=7425 RepID=A0A7M7M2N3_NASVI|nr:DNA topoisomerase 2-binding protein 1-A [Nasonia vitripennis]